jgi:hypothetical protein
MIKPQYIYKAVDFVFDNNSPPKEKFFVVFHCDDEDVLLFSLTTSQPKLPESLDTPYTSGCVIFNDERGYGHAFVWKANEVIGTNGFAFRKRTYIQLEFKAQLIEVSSERIAAKATEKIVEYCLLLNDSFRDLLMCLAQSRYLKQKHKKAILTKITELSI